jgi:hypothetical protein
MISRALLREIPPRMVGGRSCGFPSMYDYQGDQEKDYYAFEEKEVFLSYFSTKGVRIPFSPLIPTPKKHIFKY